MPDAQPTSNSMLTTSITNGTSNTNYNNTGTQQSAGQQLPYFTPTQLAMQPQAQGLMQQILTGQTPQWYGMPQSVWDAAQYNFNKFEAPALAAQYGSGSPALGAARQQLDLQLAGMGGMYAQQNQLNTFNALANWAFQPTGSSQTQTGQNNSVGDQHTSGYQMTNNINTGGLLSLGLSSFF